MLDREDYIDPQCVLCGKPGETESPKPVPMNRILEKLSQYEDRNDAQGAERHLKYWLAEAEMNRDGRGQLTLNNELMGHYRMRGMEEPARKHAEQALRLVRELEMEETIAAGTTYINAATVREAFGTPEDALPLFQLARENYERNLPEDDARLGGLYNNMGLGLCACGRYGESEALFRKAIRLAAGFPERALEEAVTWLNLADLLAARDGEEAAEKEIAWCMEQAEKLLNSEAVPRDAYYAFVCEKCAPVFGHYGYFMQEAELNRRAKGIRQEKAGH